MARGLSLKVLMQLQTKEFQKGINNIKRQLNGFGSFIRSAFAVGSVTMFGKEMVNVSKEFENSMARVKAVSNATQEEFKKLEAEALKMGYTTRYTATQAANALENLTRNGVNAANATKMLSSVLQLAQANTIELAEAANIVTNTLNMFGLSVNEANRVNDVLSSTASHAATDITGLFEAMANAAPAAKIVGFSIEETAAAIGAFAQRGIKGAEAGTKLRIAFQKMADPKINAKLKARGVEIDETTMKTEGLLKTIEKLSAANLSLGELGEIFDARSAMALGIIISSLDEFKRLLDVTSNSAGTTARMFNESIGSVQKQLDILKSKYQDLLINIGKQTSGVLKGAIKIIQDFIDNFKTVGGTIANLASVAVPLLTKRVITLGQSMKAMFAQIAAGAATAKAAMGGVVTIIATLVTWVGSAFYTAWRKSTQAMRDAKKAMADAEAEAIKTQRAVDGLKKEIGDGSNPNTVNGAIARAIKLFPEFEDAIRSAAGEAARTGNWEKLKKVLQDIADLEATIAKANANEQIAKANAEYIGGELYKSSRFRGGEWWNPSYTPQEPYADVAKEIRKGLERVNLPKEAIQSIFNEIGAILIENKDTDEKVKEIQGLLKPRMVNIDEDALKKAVNDIYGSKLGDAVTMGQSANGWETGYMATAAVTQFNMAKSEWEEQTAKIKESLKKREIDDKTYHKKMEDEALKFMNKVYSLEKLPEDYVQKAVDLTKGFYPPTVEKPEPGGDGGGGSTSKVKTDTDKIKDAIDDYNEEVTKLNNRLSAGTITQKQYKEELAKLEDKTWEAITSISKFAEILDQLGKGDFGEELKNKYIDNRNDDNAETLSEYNKKLSDYMRFPEKEDRSRGYNKKSAGEKLEEDVKIELDYADALDKFKNDLKAAIEKGEFGPIKGDALVVLEELKTKAKEAADAADTLKAKLDLSEAITKLEEQISELKVSAFDSFQTVAQAMDRVITGLMSIAEVFDEDVKDSPLFQGIEAFASVLNGGIQMMQATVAVMELVNQMKSKSAKESVKDAAMTVLADKLATKSAQEKATAEATAAAAGGAKAVASIPYVGPVLAVAAAASIATALLAAFSKFATGGIVGGNSYTGDKNIIRANSGEMVLNKHQQGTLWNMLNGKGGTGGGQVEFKIRGADLVGTLNNYNRLKS